MSYNRSVPFILTLGIVACTAVWATAAYARPLTVVGWGGPSQAAENEAYFAPFTKATGIKVLQNSWSGGIGILRTKVEGGNADWDVVQVEVDETVLGCEEGLFEKLDWKMLGGRDKYIPAAVNACGVGAMVWSQGLAYDGDHYKNGDAPRSWADFWNVKKFPGKRGMRKTAKYTLEYALMADGVKPDDVYKVLATPEGVDRAFRKLDQLRPNIVWWGALSQVPGMLHSGELAMAVATPARLIALNRQDGTHFKFVWSGSLYAVDFWTILRGSPNRDAAMRLIQYMSQPKHQALFATLIPEGVSNKAATQLVATEDPKITPDLPTDPANMVNAAPIDTEFWVEHGDALTKRFNAWAAQ